jgi:hypothetical protein
MAKRLPLLIFSCLLSFAAEAQQPVLLRGVVYDSSRLVTVPSVKVTSTSGAIAYTDSIGHYSIMVGQRDSVSFYYRGRSTNWFAVREIKYPAGFDISLQVNLPSRYQTLKEVVVVGKTYRQDSAENREKYRKVLGYESPGLRMTETDASMGGVPGFDPNEIINAFRFRRNRSLKSLRNRLLEEEMEKFIDYRFNKRTVRTISGLEGDELDRFMVMYRPDYDFCALAPDLDFYQYILEASKRYKRGLLPPSYMRLRNENQLP